MNLPAGAKLLADARVTPAITLFALEVLHSSAEMGSIVPRVVDGLSLLARLEPHTWTLSGGKRVDCDPPIRGVTVYEAGIPSTLPPPAAFAELVDVSHYQGAIDWAAVASSGRVGAFIKATERAVDDWLARHWEGAGAAGLLRGAYHFLHPDLDALEQARLFLDAMATLDAGELPPVLDVERGGSLPYQSLGKACRNWCLRVFEATGRRPLIYTSPSFWAAVPLDCRAEAASAADLWIAHWDAKAPSVPHDWKAWLFWQYGAKGSVPGISGPCDVDRFNGTVEDLRARYPRMSSA